MEKLALLHAEKAINDKVYERGLITEQMFLSVNEAIVVDIGKINTIISNANKRIGEGSWDDGAIGAKATAG